jgi:hypothetical protein
MKRLVAYWLVLLLSLLPPLAAQPADGRRLFYIGLALFAESWSENDVVELADKLRSESDFMVVPMIASDLASRRYPIADDGTVATMVSRTAAQVRPGDVIFINISTHGGPGELARKVGNHRATGMSSRALARALAPLAEHPTVIVISACYSGSLIGDLRAPKRIIMTAARADRSSFGCGAGNRHTFFGQAELDAFGHSGRNLRQVFEAIRAKVSQMEREQGFTPSQPQVWVGPDATDLYDAAEF